MIKTDTTPEERALAIKQKEESRKQARLKRSLEVFEDMLGESIVCDDDGRFEYKGIVGYVEPLECSDGYLDWDEIVLDVYHRKLKKIFNFKKMRFEMVTEYTKTRVGRCSFEFGGPCIFTYPDCLKKALEDNKLAQEFKND